MSLTNFEPLSFCNLKEDWALSGYKHHAKGASKALHFLHGNGFAVGSYSKVIAPLARDYSVIAQDAAGHGNSPAGKSFVGWNQTASRFNESLTQYIEHSSCPLYGIGHSFGGCMTLLMSVQDPKQFEQLVLLDPALFPPRLIWLLRGVRMAGLDHYVPLAKRTRKRRTQWDSYAQVKANFTGRGIFKGWDDDCLDDYIRYSLSCDDKGHYHLSCSTWMEAAIFSSYPKGLWKAIKQLSVPTHIVYGKNTYKYFKEAYRLAAKINSNIKLIEVEGEHCFMQERPSDTVEVIRDLLK
ncbi:alpha/beta fold hydrolase [Marinomonas balearica]|uniref:Pimeloyl-ACP methyl ester carboxylesterase n=1 Tax=Marinomonas balearica TaxID=491947 RepID=A0A4R6M711_9GAMM|nr:alpha/beta hydrolase [Marinomonas balearica]TDO97187.1 pimeloyl-ACP methyl ester carboxylesterase [Marinomonas balearica]